MPIRKLVIAILMFVSLPAFGAVAAKVQWDVQTTGSATNGGGFDPSVGSPGTDESMGAGTSTTCTVQTTTTQVICVPAISATTHGPGNIIGPMTGSGCTTSAWLEILSQSAGTATLSSTAGTAGSVCTGTLGGSLADYKNAVVSGGAVAFNTFWVQGTYTYTATPTITAIGFAIHGYSTVHGDAGQATLTTATNSTVLFAGATNQGYTFTNIIFTNTAGTKAAGIQGTIFLGLYNCTFNGFTNAVNTVFSLFASDILIENSTGVSIQGTVTTGTYAIWNSQIINGAAAGIVPGTEEPLIVENSIIAGNTIGISMAANRQASTVLIDNTIPSNTSDGIKFVSFSSATGVYPTTTVIGNILYGNGGFGINSGALTILPQGNGPNAYGANTSGARNVWPAGTGDVTLTANPFTNSGTGDYSLNNTAGGGASLRGTGYPGVFPGGIPTGFSDIGAVQHQDSGTGASNYGFVQ